jgi:transcriptional regulator with XRE-family HTH domain
MKRRHRAGGGQKGPSTGPARAAFAERLRTLMAERRLSAAELVRRVREQVPEGKFSLASLTQYRQGRALPQPRYLDALSQALGVEPSELLGQPTPQPEQPSPAPAAPTRSSEFLLEDRGSRARIRLDLEVPWDVAFEIMRLLRLDQKDP